MNFGLTPPHHFLEEIYKSVFDIDGPEYVTRYAKVSYVPESRVWFASKNLTDCRMH